MAAADGEERWPRYIRTTDIKSLFQLHADKRVTLPPAVARRALVARGDVLMTAAGSLGTSYLHDTDEAACYAGYLVRFRAVKALACPRFIAYWTQSEHHLSQLEQGAVRSTIDNFSAGKFRAMFVPHPPVQEQRRIADFLDDQVARLDAAFEQTARLSAVLQARCQVAIDQIFDGSGRPTRLRSLLQQHPQYGVLVPQLVDSGVPFIRIKDLAAVGRGDRSGLAQIASTQSREYRRTVVRSGDVLLGVVGSIDTFAVVPTVLAGANIARAVARLVPRREVPAGVLAGFLQTTSYRRQARAVTDADTAQPTLNMSDLRGFVVPLPAADWRSIEVAARGVEDQRADGLREVGGLLHLLDERRRALITACVTGEFDVATASSRAAAAALAGVG